MSFKTEAVMLHIEFYSLSIKYILHIFSTTKTNKIHVRIRTKTVTNSLVMDKETPYWWWCSSVSQSQGKLAVLCSSKPMVSMAHGAGRKRCTQTCPLLQSHHIAQYRRKKTETYGPPCSPQMYPPTGLPFTLLRQTMSQRYLPAVCLAWGGSHHYVQVRGSQMVDKEKWSSLSVIKRWNWRLDRGEE